MHPAAARSRWNRPVPAHNGRGKPAAQTQAALEARALSVAQPQATLAALRALLAGWENPRQRTRGCFGGIEQRSPDMLPHPAARNLLRVFRGERPYPDS